MCIRDSRRPLQPDGFCLLDTGHESLVLADSHQSALADARHHALDVWPDTILAAYRYTVDALD